LDESTLAGHAQGRYRVGEAGEQDQPLGNEADDCGNRGRHGFLERGPAFSQRRAQEEAERHHHEEQRQEQAVERSLER
jgi:hypothetical protein